MKVSTLEILKACLKRGLGDINPTEGRKVKAEERELVFNVVYRYAELYRGDVCDEENKEKRHMDTLDFFEKELDRLGIDGSVKEFLYCICLLGVALQSDLLGYENFLNSLLDKYPLYSLCKIFMIFEENYLADPEALDSRRFQNNIFIDIEHIIFVDYALNSQGRCGRYWLKLEAVFDLIDKADLLPLECNLRLVNVKCREVFCKGFEEMESLFGKNNTLWLAIQCLISGEHKEEDIKRYFTYHAFFAAKTFIAKFRQIHIASKGEFFELSCFQQVDYLCAALMHTSSLDYLSRQYLDSIGENFNPN